MALTMPAVTVFSRPKGLPIATTHWPTLRSSESPSTTSGIGLGIATSLAAEGCNLLLNGFGDPKAIEALRAELAEKYRIKVVYSPADMSKPADIRAMIA